MGTLWQDIRHGLRMLARSPGFTTVVVLVLALGIGANTAIFTMTRSVLLSPLPFRDPQRLVLVNIESKKTGNRFACSGPEYLDWQEQNTVFDEISALVPGRVSLTGAGDPIALSMLRVTPGLFRTLGVQPALGRGFLEEETETSGRHVTVLGHRLWKDAFGGDPYIVGKEITLDGVPSTVIGVSAPAMGFIEDLAQLYMPLPREELQVGRTNRYLAVLGRLKPGISVERAQGQMNLIAERLAQQYPQSNKDIGALVNSLHTLLATYVRTAFLVLHGAVAILLLIACANVSNLLLARSGVRAREIAVRSALGASRGRLLRQMLTESILLALAGGGLGVVLALWGLEALKQVAPKLPATGGNLPGFDEIHLDPAVLGFTAVLSVATAVAFGLLPAWRTSRYKFRRALGECARGVSEGLSRQHMLGTLVVSQIALALVLLTGSGLLIRSFARLAGVNPGFVPQGLLAVQIERPETPDNRESFKRAAFYQQVVDQLTNLPGVEAACAINLHPMAAGNYRTSFDVKDETSAAAKSINGEYRMVTSDYFRCMRIPLLKGRYFTPSDAVTGEAVAIINQEFVRRSLPGEEPLDKSVTIHGATRKIIGVVADVKEFSLNEQGPPPTVYEPIHQNCSHGMTILVRTGQDPMQLIGPVRRAIWEIDPSQPILRSQTMSQIVGATTSVPRFSMILFLAMGCAALWMALAGIYAMAAYAVNERRHEIGIRMALGAESGDILKLVVGRGTRLAFIGLALGLASALVLSRCVSSLLFEISPTDPVTFLLVPAMLLAASLSACYLPARRAARVDPMTALRCE